MPTMHTLEDYSDLIKSYIDAKDSAKADVSSLGTAAAKDVPSSGNASTTQVVMGNDTRLSDSRNAKDVSSWAKASSKPTYNGSEIKTNVAKTGSGTTVTSTIPANTTMDNAIGTLLNNDVAENTTIQNLSNLLSEVGAVNYARCDMVTQTSDGVTWTVNSDGTVTATVTASHTSDRMIMYNTDTSLSTRCGGSFDTRTTAEVVSTNGKYKISGNPSTEARVGVNSSGLYLYINKGVSSGTFTFKPMICPVEYTGSYVPYAKTNRELTEDTALKKYTMEITNMSSVTSKSLSKSGNVKFFNLSGQNSAGYDAGTSYQLTVLPSDFLPSAYFSKEIMLRNGVQSFFEIAANGTVRIVPRSAVAANAGIAISEIFI